MAKKSQGSRGSLIGAVGSVILGAAILLFVSTMVLNSLKNASNDDDVNSTVEQLQTFLTICTVLLGVLGITMIGAAIIGYIGGAFGGGGV